MSVERELVLLAVFAIVLIGWIAWMWWEDRRDQRNYDTSTPPNIERWPPKIDP